VGPEPSRRALLTTAVAGAAAAGVVASRTADADSPQLTSVPVSRDPVLHAVRRLSYGATPALVAHVRRVGVSAWVDQQLSGQPDASAVLHGTGLASVPLPPVQGAMARAAVQHHGLTDLQTQAFARAAFGDNQLYELLVELFSNHLSIYGPAFAAYKAVDDSEVVRKHALGTFAGMLAASAQSPAMLLYLNQAYSIGDNPNENYARELLELHTVGATAGYHQRDVHQAALALTGLSVDPDTGLFRYRSDWHHVGPVRVMGWSHPNGDRSKGLEVALSLVDYLAHHPMTARRLATKLVRRFVSDAPPASLVASAAAVYRANGTAIVPVVKHVLASREFQRSFGQKAQRPFEWFVQCVRVLGLAPSPTLALEGGSVVAALQRLGQAPFAWSPPNGYPDTADAYASTATMLARWNTAQALVNGSVSGLGRPDAARVRGTPVPTTARACVERLALVLLGIRPRAALTRAVLTGVGLPAGRVLTAAEARERALPMAALLLSSPEALVR
jgi:uncharacterized protein (DUF1800 family)